MSLLAKILVIFNLVLALAFFGSSATLFLNRTEWREQALEYQKQAEAGLQQVAADLEGPKERTHQLAQENARLETKGNELATTNRQLQNDVKGLKGTINEVEISKTQMAEAVEASNKLSGRLQQQNDQLQGTIKELTNKAASAEDARAAAQRDVTRIKLSYDQLKALHSDLLIAKKDAEDELEQAQIVISAAEKRLNIDLDDPTPQRQVDGQVEAVDLENELVVLSVGRDQGVREGAQYTVSRGDSYIGKVKVIQLYDDFAGARIIYASDGDDIEVGDRILTPAY